MRRDIRDVLVAWTTGLLSLAAAAALLTGCGPGFSPVSASTTTEKEAWAAAEVVRLAAKLHKKFHAEFAEKALIVPAGYGGCGGPMACAAFAWFDPPRVVFHREAVNRESTTLSLLTDIAGHEVCHTLSYNHDQTHWNCTVAVGVNPTYQRPEGQ